MTITKKIYLLLIPCILQTSILAHKRVVQISIPKCGTHLLAKLITQLTGRSWLSDLSLFSIVADSSRQLYTITEQEYALFCNLPKNYFWITHLIHTKAMGDKICIYEGAPIFLYRDPRDQMVSLIFYRRQDPARWPKITNISFDEMLFDLIRHNSITPNDPPGDNILDVYNNYLPWMQVSNMYTVRFEDLIGPQGGGSQEAQHKVIYEIATHIGISITREQVIALASRLFGTKPGEPGTFREGKIGSWKKYFTPEHKKAFKEVAGQLLIDLGYEKDMNW